MYASFCVCLPLVKDSSGRVQSYIKCLLMHSEKRSYCMSKLYVPVWERCLEHWQTTFRTHFFAKFTFVSFSFVDRIQVLECHVGNFLTMLSGSVLFGCTYNMWMLRRFMGVAPYVKSQQLQRLWGGDSERWRHPCRYCCDSASWIWR